MYVTHPPYYDPDDPRIPKSKPSVQMPEKPGYYWAYQEHSDTWLVVNLIYDIGGKLNVLLFGVMKSNTPEWWGITKFGPEIVFNEEVEKD